MSCINKATLIGHLGKDPEYTQTSYGDTICKFTLATSEKWTDKRSGDKREATQWHNIVIYNQTTANFVESHVSKGDKVYIEGKITTKKWADDHGNNRQAFLITIGQYDGKLLLLNKKDSQSSTSSEEYQSNNIDDEIPF